jgi:hypothetical protein
VKQGQVPLTSILSRGIVRLSFFALLISIVGCSKPNEIGSNLVSTNFADYFDSLNVTLTNAPRDTVRTDKMLYYPMGNYYDPLVGRVSAHVHTQFLLTGTNVNFGTAQNLRYDSLILYVTYRGSYTGDPTQLQELEAYELEDSLEYTRAYYSDVEVRTQPAQLAESAAFIRPKSPSSAQVIGIRMNRTLGEKLLYAPAYALKNNEAFRKYFKGLRFGTKRNNPGQTGSVLILDRINTTRLRLHYTDLSTSTNKLYDFLVDGYASGYVNYAVTENGGTLYEQLKNDPTGFGQQYLFTHSGLGYQIRGRINNPAGIGKIAVNRVVLSLPVDASALADSFIFRRPRLQLVANKQDSVTPNLIAVISYADYNPLTRSYEFVLTRYFQHLNLNQPIYYIVDSLNQITATVRNTGFTILPINRNFTLDRMVLLGPKNALKPKLKVYYTPVPL